MCVRCGSAEGLDAGRHCLRKWGFRRCEDICWIKTNVAPERKGALRPDAHSVLQHTKVCARASGVITTEPYSMRVSASLEPASLPAKALHC